MQILTIFLTIFDDKNVQK